MIFFPTKPSKITLNIQKIIILKHCSLFSILVFLFSAHGHPNEFFRKGAKYFRGHNVKLISRRPTKVHKKNKTDKNKCQYFHMFCVFPVSLVVSYHLLLTSKMISAFSKTFPKSRGGGNGPFLPSGRRCFRTLFSFRRNI